jgi:peptidyl-prolyl cis-trans isomerase SurA
VRRNVDVLRTSMKLGAALAAAGIAVTACGQVQMGAAAILGSQRISAAALSAQVDNLNAGYHTYHGKIQLQYPVSQMPQQALSWLVRFRVRDALAARENVTVSRGDAQRALDQINAQIRQGGGSATLPELAVANGLPPDLITDLGRYQAIENAVIARLDGGKLPAKQAALQVLQSRFNVAQCRASKSLNIKINPQFGMLDYSQLSVISAPPSLSAAAAAAASPSPSPSASAKPQLTPPC